MRRTICSFMTAFLAFGLFLFPVNSAQAREFNVMPFTNMGDQDFTLVNKTGFEIYAVYVSPHEADEWGEDILGRDTLVNDESVLIKFSRKETARYWDLRVEDEKGKYIEWEKFDLLEISTIKLYYKNGKATAIVD